MFSIKATALRKALCFFFIFIIISPQPVRSEPFVGYRNVFMGAAALINISLLISVTRKASKKRPKTENKPILLNQPSISDKPLNTEKNYKNQL